MSEPGTQGMLEDKEKETIHTKKDEERNTPEIEVEVKEVKATEAETPKKKTEEPKVKHTYIQTTLRKKRNTHTDEHTHTLSLEPKASKQKKIAQKPCFKNPRKKANSKLSTATQYNKINMYFTIGTNKSERGTGNQDLEPNNIKFANQDQRRTRRPEGQVDHHQDQDRHCPGPSSSTTVLN